MSESKRPSLHDDDFVRRLLAGALVLGHLSAAEPADVVVSFLVDEPDGAESIDTQCLELLEAHRRTLLTYDGGRFDVELLRLVSLVAIVHRIRPRRTIGSFHSEFVKWNRFFRNFVIDRGLDLRRDYWRVLATTQDLGAEVAGLEPRRLMPMWLSICSGSGDRGDYPDHYLEVGMLGLRRLPLVGDIASNDDFVLHGLARWAAWQRPTREHFLREWHLIEGDFPRSDAFWRDHAEAAIAAVENEVRERIHGDAGDVFVAAAWWRKALKGKTVVSAMRGRGRSALEPPDKRLWKSLLRDIERPMVELSARLDAMMASYVRHAELSGDVFYLVRTACNVGMRLLENGATSERPARAARAVGLAEIALAQEPSNVYAWALRRGALAEMGRTRDAVLIGWETIRLFPENAQWRNQLARLLGSLGDVDEARALLRETIALFPDDVVAMTLAASIEADLFDDREEARRLLDRVLEIEPDNKTAAGYLESLNRGRRLVRTHPPLVSIGDAGGDGVLDLPAAEARHILFRYENGLDSEEQALERLSALERDPYVVFATSRITGQGRDAAFDIAFDRYARAHAVDDLRDLAEDVRPIERRLIDAAVAIIEGRVPEVDAANDNLPGPMTRLRKLIEHFGSAHAPSQANQLRLLGDMSASMSSWALAA